MSLNPVDYLQGAIPSKGVAPSGFHKIQCPCQKPSEQPKGGFAFDGDLIIYHCFKAHCHIKTVVWDINDPIPYKMSKLLQELSIPVDPSWRLKLKTEKYSESQLYKDPEFEYLDIDKLPIRKLSKHDKQQINYLLSRYCNPDDWYIGTGSYDGKQITGMVVKLLKYHDKVIGFQARSIHTKRYFTVGKSVIYIPNYIDPKLPVFVVEGVFDAILPNTIATLCDTVSKQQAWILDKYHDRIILIPDRTGNKYPQIAEKYGWKIALPEYNAKDVSEAVDKYGKLVVVRMIMESVTSPEEARLKYGFWKF